MKYVLSLISFLLVWLFSFAFVWEVSANPVFKNTTNQIPYCKWGDCWLQEWIEAVKNIDDLSKEKDAATYVTKVVSYIITFTYLIAVILIIYAWFNLLILSWDEEKAKKTKTMILYVIIWILLIFLAWPIVNFVVSAITK